MRGRDGPGSRKGRIVRRRKPLAREGETRWSLERNAAAAGFFDVDDYLQWRQDGGPVA